MSLVVRVGELAEHLRAERRTLPRIHHLRRKAGGDVVVELELEPHDAQVPEVRAALHHIFAEYLRAGRSMSVYDSDEQSAVFGLRMHSTRHLYFSSRLTCLLLTKARPVLSIERTANIKRTNSAQSIIDQTK